MSRVITAFSEAGQGKSTFALHRTRLGYEGLKTAFAEFDAGSYDRAAKGMKIDPNLVTFRRFRTPLTALMDRGKLDTSQRGESGRGAVNVAHRYRGWDEEWWTFCSWFIDILEATEPDGTPTYGTIVIDSMTKCWAMCQNAFQQRIQDEVEEQKEKLTRLEYRECNAQMNQLVDGARDRDIDLVLLAHVGSVWRGGKQIEGEIKPDGWSDAGNVSDLTLFFQVRGVKPIASVYKAGGADLSFIGREIEEPNIDDVIRLLDCAAAIRAEGMQLPKSNQDILNTGKLLLSEA